MTNLAEERRNPNKNKKAIHMEQNTTTICVVRSKVEGRRIESCINKVYAKSLKRLDSIIKFILSTKLSDR